MSDAQFSHRHPFWGFVPLAGRQMLCHNIMLWSSTPNYFVSVYMKQSQWWCQLVVDLRTRASYWNT